MTGRDAEAGVREAVFFDATPRVTDLTGLTDDEVVELLREAARNIRQALLTSCWLAAQELTNRAHEYVDALNERITAHLAAEPPIEPPPVEPEPGRRREHERER